MICYPHNPKYATHIFADVATWLAGNGAIIKDDASLIDPWGDTLTLTALVVSMVVNALVTGLIVFKIFKVFLEVRPTSVEETLGSLNSTRGPKLQRIIFIIIESGMALFAIQLARVVVTSLVELQAGLGPQSLQLEIALDFIIPIHQALNVILRSVHFYFLCFTDDIYLPRGLHQQ